MRNTRKKKHFIKMNDKKLTDSIIIEKKINTELPALEC